MFDLREHVILKGEYGSVAQGTAGPDSDHDYMAVFVEPPEVVMGLSSVESHRESDAAEGERSEPGSSDMTYHSLRKFAKLAAAGNPTLLSILFLPEYEVQTFEGIELLGVRSAFVSRQAGNAYHGYMTAQLQALDDGKRQRKELVDQYGYDTKFAYHAYRLGIQGIQVMLYGAPIQPMIGVHLDMAKQIRAGEMDIDDVVDLLRRVKKNLTTAIDNTRFPDYADYEAINAALINIHQEYWRTH